MNWKAYRSSQDHSENDIRSLFGSPELQTCQAHQECESVKLHTHLHDELDLGRDSPAHGQVQLAADFLLGGAPAKSEPPRLELVSMQLRDVSERNDHLAQEDIMAQSLSTIYSHLQTSKHLTLLLIYKQMRLLARIRRMPENSSTLMPAFCP